ncbi:MAG: hypothetical protein WCJ58_04250 [bacterium]
MMKKVILSVSTVIAIATIALGSLLFTQSSVSEAYGPVQLEICKFKDSTTTFRCTRSPIKADLGIMPSKYYLSLSDKKDNVDQTSELYYCNTLTDTKTEDCEKVSVDMVNHSDKCQMTLGKSSVKIKFDCTNNNKKQAFPAGYYYSNSTADGTGEILVCKKTDAANKIIKQCKPIARDFKHNG